MERENKPMNREIPLNKADGQAREDCSGTRRKAGRELLVISRQKEPPVKRP